jgi:hypothetical protein
MGEMGQKEGLGQMEGLEQQSSLLYSIVCCKSCINTMQYEYLPA